mgnify:CR=1 FL=1
MELHLSIEKELATARAAILENNEGKARVCARRAIVLTVQNSPVSGQTQWNSRLALEYLTNADMFPSEIVKAAKRLQGGLRAQLQGEEYSENSIEDAKINICYFLDLP